MFHLPDEYGAAYNHLLKEMGLNLKTPQESMALFWPMRGRQYTGDLFVIGHRTNKWDVNGTKQDLAQPEKREQFIKELRLISESEAHCPMLWLIHRHKYDPTNSYDGNKSKFFGVMKQLFLQENPDADREKKEDWASWFCYSNLLKVEDAPTSKQPMILQDYVSLLKQEINAFCPKRILVLAGEERFSPFAKPLELDINPHQGVVKGTAMQNGIQWVITQHPMILPAGGSIESFADEVSKAFASLQE